MLENGFEFSDGTWIDQGFIISPAPRKSTDYIFGLISDIEKEILYSDVKSKTYTTLIETYLCDQSSRLFKKKQEKTLTQNDLQSTWEKASTMAVRIRNVAMLNNADDLYYSSVETCKRVQEILIRILKITWSNEMFTFHVNTDIDHSVVITFVTYDGEEEVINMLLNI
jgi:hypothetical protein